MSADTALRSGSRTSCTRATSYPARIWGRSRQVRGYTRSQPARPPADPSCILIPSRNPTRRLRPHLGDDTAAGRVRHFAVAKTLDVEGSDAQSRGPDGCQRPEQGQQGPGPGHGLEQNGWEGRGSVGSGHPVPAGSQKARPPCTPGRGAQGPLPPSLLGARAPGEGPCLSSSQPKPALRDSPGLLMRWCPRLRAPGPSGSQASCPGPVCGVAAVASEPSWYLRPWPWHREGPAALGPTPSIKMVPGFPAPIPRESPKGRRQSVLSQLWCPEPGVGGPPCPQALSSPPARARSLRWVPSRGQGRGIREASICRAAPTPVPTTENAHVDAEAGSSRPRQPQDPFHPARQARGSRGSQLGQGSTGCLSACQRRPHTTEAPPGLAGGPGQSGPGRQVLPAPRQPLQ